MKRGRMLMLLMGLGAWTLTPAPSTAHDPPDFDHVIVEVWAGSVRHDIPLGALPLSDQWHIGLALGLLERGDESWLRASPEIRNHPISRALELRQRRNDTAEIECVFEGAEGVGCYFDEPLMFCGVMWGDKFAVGCW